jgi:hypothetical protein
MDRSSLQENLNKLLAYHASANPVLGTAIPTYQKLLDALNWHSMSPAWENAIIGFIDVLGAEINDTTIPRMVQYCCTVGYCAALR